MPPPIAPGAFERLMCYCWPGNVRELENLVERELIVFKGGQLTFDSLRTVDKSRETIFIPEGPLGKPLSLDEAMCMHICKVLKTTNGRIQGPGGAAELLGINHNTLRARMRKLSILFGDKNHKIS